MLDTEATHAVAIERWRVRCSLTDGVLIRAPRDDNGAPILSAETALEFAQSQLDEERSRALARSLIALSAPRFDRDDRRRLMTFHDRMLNDRAAALAESAEVLSILRDEILAPAQSARSLTDEDSQLSPAQIGQKFNVPMKALRARLDRWRRNNASGWSEIADRGPRDEKYIYRVGSIWHVINDLQTGSERGAK